MASKKKESEGIALLSMYNDEEEEEDEEMEDINEDSPKNVEEEDTQNLNKIPSDSIHEHPASGSPHLQSQDSLPTEETYINEDRVPTPPEPQIPVSSPLSPSLELPSTVLTTAVDVQSVKYIGSTMTTTVDVQRVKKRGLTIVDYAHDETAMSPEAEEGEIMGTGHVVFREDLQTADGNFQGITPPGTVQILTPSIQESPAQPPEQQGISQSDNNITTTCVNMELEMTESKETIMVSVEGQTDVDPLDNFLPPPPKTVCSDALQEKINKFLAFKRGGKSFNTEVRNRKDYRNPDFLVHAVRYQDIDEIGSCFNKDVFDPHGYDKSDFYDEIEADMKREMERKEQERKKSQKLDFVSGGTHVGVVAAQRINIQNPVAPTVASTGFSSGFSSHPIPVDSVTRDRQNKKSKWDKVDSDRRNPLHGGQDSLSTAAAHAAILSATNVGAGYTAFAQQKRKEAEERKSSDRRRS